MTYHMLSFTILSKEVNYQKYEMTDYYNNFSQKIKNHYSQLGLRAKTTMQSDQTFIEKTFELINELTGNITFITIKVAYLTTTRQINISRAISDIHNNVQGFNLEKSLIFYLDNVKRLYVHVGTFPFPKHFELLLKFELFLETTIKLRFRKLSGPNSPKNEKKPIAPCSKPSKPTRKEKTIQQVQEIVTKWRTLFQSYDENGKKAYTLESAAQSLGMQKKTLDDYYYKLKNAHALGFDFEKHKSEKIGVLRQFVKESKKSKQPTSIPTPVFNQWLNKNSQQQPGQSYGGGGGVFCQAPQNPSGLGGTSYAANSFPQSFPPPQKPSQDDIDKYLVKDDEDFESSESEQSD